MAASRIAFIMFFLLLVGVAAACFSAPPSPASLPSETPEAVLPSRHFADEGEALAFFRSRTRYASLSEVHALATMLSDRRFAVRRRAEEELAQLGGRARPVLRDLLDDPDPEVRRRAQACLSRLREEPTDEAAAAAHWLAARLSPAGLQAILNYAPHALCDATLHQLAAALGPYAARDADAQQALRAALGDEWPAIRAVAAAGLLHGQGQAALPAVRPLFRDSDLKVRLLLGTTLARLNFAEGLAVLIDLFGRLPRSQLYEAEELLYHIAGDDAPDAALGATEASRQQFRDAWLGWWRTRGQHLDLAEARKERRHDHTIVLLLDEGAAVELDAQDRPRWRMENLAFPLDIQKLSGCRILVAEQGGGKVTERHRSGAVLWEKIADGPLVAQRLPNGNTFIATKNTLTEVDRDGRQLYVYERETLREQFMRAVKLPDGGYAFVTSRQWFYRLDADRQEVVSFRVNVGTFGGRIDVLPNGNVLVPHLRHHRVVEFDSRGNGVSELDVEEPITAVRLANGHTLATSLSGMKVVEFDPLGRKIWEYAVGNSRLNRAVRY